MAKHAGLTRPKEEVVQNANYENVKLPTISEYKLEMMWRQDPFDAFETIPTAENRIRCLDQIASDGSYLSRLLAWAPGWLEFFLEKQDTQIVNKLLNVWVFHFAHSGPSLAKTLNSALSLALDRRFVDGASTLKVFSREVCSRLLKAGSKMYWEIPRLHRFLDTCLSRFLSTPFQEKDWNVVRRALKVVCEAGDTSMLPRLAELRDLYRDFRKDVLEAPVNNPTILWKRLDVVHYDSFLEECIAYLSNRKWEENGQWLVFKKLLHAGGRKIGNISPKPFLKYPSPQHAHSANPATVGISIGGVEGAADNGLLLNLVDGLTVTFLGYGIENTQVVATNPAFPTVPTVDKVGKFDSYLECEFRLDGGMEGRKRFDLQVHRTKPAPELRPTLICTLTGYLQFE